MRSIALVVMTLCIASWGVAQGLYWQTKTEGGVMGDRTSEMFAVPKKFKVVDHGSKDASVTIIRLDKEVLWHLKPEEKTYTEMTFAQLEAMMKKAGGKMDAQMSKMQKEMEGMSPEQRKMVEGMMKGKMPGMGDSNDAPLEVKNTKEKKSISGFSCTKYVVMQGEEETMTLWTTKDVKGFDEMRDDWKAFSNRMASMTQRFGKGMAEAYKNIDGFPIQTIFGHGMTSTVTKVERRSTPASEFEIPTGYTKTKGEMEDAMEKMDKEDK